MGALQRQSRFERGDDVVVMKFGGTSVEDASAIRRLIAIVHSRRGAQSVIVVSALAGVTDQLLEAGQAAAQGHLGSALAVVRDVYVRHERLAESLVGGPVYSVLESDLRSEFRALESLLQNLDASRQLNLKSRDRLLAFGECFSSKLLKDALCEANVAAVHVDARTCIVTDARHGQASPIWDLTNQRIQEAFIPILQEDRVPVLGGFIASTSEGVPTTLGRGGSDFTAAIVAAALSAARIEIWTDVDGVMTTDPKLCSDARVIRKMSFDDAAELARLGAKILHPATLAPAMRENIPVHVLNSKRPDGKGTEITVRTGTAKAVSAITAKRDVAMVEIEAVHGIDPSLLAAIFAVFDRHSCSVDVMATSPGRMSFLLGSDAALPGTIADLQRIAEVRWENHKALVSLVGDNMPRQPEVASRIFAAIADMDVRVLCQGASDRTISFLVEESKVEESVQRLHAVFFPRAEPVRDWGGISSAYCQAG
jgi:aspartate kinase